MSKVARIGAAALGGAVAVLAMAACQPAIATDASGTPAGGPASVSASASVGTAPSTGGGKSGQPSGSAKPSHGSGSGTGTGGGTGGPHIVYFKITKQPKCPQGTDKYRSAAVPVEISWKVTGATGIALSVDNPHVVGSYGSHDAEGKLSFEFSCGGPANSTETHTYRITTTGGHGPAQTSPVLTASAKVYEIATT